MADNKAENNDEVLSVELARKGLQSIENALKHVETAVLELYDDETLNSEKMCQGRVDTYKKLEELGLTSTEANAVLLSAACIALQDTYVQCLAAVEILEGKEPN